MTRASRTAALAAPLLLAACANDGLIAPFGRSGGLTETSLNIERVRGNPPQIAALTYEPGTVWPAPSAEPARATLFNPEAPTPIGAAQPPPPPEPPPARPRVGSSAPPPPPAAPTDAERLRAQDVTTPNRAPPAPRLEGRVIQTPQGPVTITGGTPGAQTFTTPGGGTGIAIPQGPTTTLIGPGGQVTTVPTPR
jgi:hypothetical protein